MGAYAEYLAGGASSELTLSLWTKSSQRFIDRVLDKLLSRRAVGCRTSEEGWESKSQFVEPLVENHSKLSRTWSRTSPPRILHLVGSLQPGGAERQVCYCAIEQKKLGLDVSVMVLNRCAAEHAHYLAALQDAGIKVKLTGSQLATQFKAYCREAANREKIAKLAVIPHEFTPMTLDIFGELVMDSPHVFHCWLDHTNIWGGVAALLAEVPLVVLSTRNVNPDHFPYLATPYFKAMYRQLACGRNIRLINNSFAGADDYANWLGVSRDLFSVVLNGVDLASFRQPDDQQILAFRREIGVPVESPIVAGVFRLSEEKQPLTFLEVACRLTRANPDLHFVIAGIGPCEEEMRRFIAEHDLSQRVRLIGRRGDVGSIFSSATVTLLCSRQEGTPNVLLEAQAHGCPVVATKAGGAVDAVDHGSTGFLLDVGDVDGLCDRVQLLIRDPVLRKKFSANGPDFVRKTFGVERMAEETTNLYFQ